MLVAYVSGPYRSPKGHYGVAVNTHRAWDYACYLWGLGYAVICPHSNTYAMDGAFQKSEDVFIRGDCELVSRSDILIAIGGWEQSAGALLEIQRAFLEGKPVLDSGRIEDSKAIEDIAANRILLSSPIIGELSEQMQAAYVQASNRYHERDASEGKGRKR